MNSRRIDGVNRVDSRENCGNRRAREIVNQRSEDRVFLRRPSDNREWPNGVFAMVDGIDIHHRKIVRQAVVAEMISEGTFRQLAIGIDCSADAEISFRTDHGAGSVANHSYSPP